MNPFTGKNEYDLKIEENEEWFEVHSGAVTNTTPGSMVYVTIDTTPICGNMTDREFRKTVLQLRDEAVEIVEQRIRELRIWNTSAQARARRWFGIADERTRQTLLAGLPAVARVMKDLTGSNFVRPDSYQDKATGCVPNRKNLKGEVAHVCGPDTTTHTIAVTSGFCEMPNRSAGTLSSKQLTIVHECTHFADTFGSIDYNNTYGQFLGMRLAQTEPDMAIKNADNIAWYILCAD